MNAIAVSGSTIYVGGTFNTLEADCIGGLDVTRNHLAAFDETSCPLDWNPDVDNAVQSLAVAGGSVYAGGKFTTVGGSTRNHLAGISITSGQPTNFDPNVNGEVDALAASGTTLFAGGSFSQVNGTTTRGSAAAFEIGSGGAGEFGVGAATPWDPQVAGTVNAIAVSGQNVYLGGNFNSIGPCPVCQQGSAGAVTASSGAGLPSWLPEPNANVYAIALGPSNVMLGGDFTAVGFPRHGSPNPVPEPNAVVRGGFAPFNGLPEPPANVAASPRDGGATVTFGTSPFTGGSAITQYKVTVSPGGQVVTGSSSPIVVNGLTNNAQYTFTVSATNGVGEGAPSLPTSPVTPMPAPSVPGKPTDVTGTAGDGQVDVAFTAPSNGNSPITGYTVTVSPGNRQVQGNGSPITVTGLTNGQAYTFTVMATNGIGDGPTSDPSGPVTPRGIPGAATNVVATSGNGQVTVTFDAPPENGSPITGYRVVSSPEGHVGTGTTTQIVVPGLHNGTSYTFTVTATNGVGDGPASAPSNAVTPRTTPGPPTNVVAVPGNTSATVSFSPPADNGGDEPHLYTVTSSGGQTAQGLGSPIPIGGLTNGQSYTFTVAATNDAGKGPGSAPSPAVTPRTVPGAPTGVTVTPGDEQVTITYAAPSDDGGAPITRYTATSSDGQFSGTSNDVSAIVIPGLTNGVGYVFSVTAENIAGTGPPSANSTAVAPRTVPGAPTHAAATPGLGQASVSFTPPTTDGGVAIIDYTVRSTPGNFTGTGTGSPIVVSGLTNGVSYSFTVTARNAAGSSISSTASNSVTPGVTPNPPDPPTGVTAAAGNAQATVSFTPPVNNGGAAVIDYTVTSSPGGISATGTSSPITVAGLTNNQAYTFTVKARNATASSNASAASNQVTPVPGNSAPGAPTGVTATAGNGQATISFNAPSSNGGTPITLYKVTSSPGGRIASGPAGPLTVTGLTNGQSYTFTVVATNAIGDGPASSPSNAVTPSFVALSPGAPTGVFATPGNAMAVVSFTPPVVDGGATIASYTVTVSPGGATVSGSSSPIVVRGLTNGTAYTFTVTATNTAGTGSASSASAPVTPAIAQRSAPPAPPAPTPRPDVPAVPPQTTPRTPPPSH